MTIFSLMSLLLLLTACSSSQETGSPGAKPQREPKSLIVLDNTKAIEHTIEASKGGYLGITATDGVKARVLFSRESLSKDATLVVTPLAKAPLEDKDLVARGFTLEEKGTGKGPSLKLPVVLVFAIKGTLPDTASIVKYHDNDKGYEVIPTKIVAKNGTTILSASVSGFSSYGARNIKPQEQQAAGKEGQAGSQIWVITVNDSYSFNNGPMKTKITMNLKATSQSGSIEGSYKGTASASVQQDMSGGGGKLSVPTTANDDNLSFIVDFPLAALTEPEEPLASLVPPGSGPDWSAYGNLNMAAKGSYDIQAGGYRKQGGISPKDAPVPFELTVMGSHVKVMVKHPIGTLFFDGTIASDSQE